MSAYGRDSLGTKINGELEQGEEMTDDLLPSTLDDDGSDFHRPVSCLPYRVVVVATTLAGKRVVTKRGRDMYASSF